MKHLCLLAVIAATGCTSLNPITLARLALLDPLTLDPEQIRVVVTVPDGFGVQQDGTVMSIFGQPDPETPQVTDEFVLDSAEMAGANVLRIAPNDVDRMRAAQAKFAAWEAADPDAARGGFSIYTQPCFQDRQLPLSDVTGVASLSIQVTDAGGPLPLFRNVPMQDLAAMAMENYPDFDTLPLCHTGD
ncbi:MAG: hypothetical protein AAF386_01085 [Pseudomonadota bacterium]